MSYLGDIRASQILYFHFTTRQFSTGAPITSANLAISVYKNDSTSQSTSGITTTFTLGFDGVVGLVSVKIDTSSDGTFYAAGNDFSVVVTTGTADAVSIVGEVVGYFSIENRSAITSFASAFTTQVTEAYRANGAAPTLAQFMSEVLAHLGEAAISGTTKTIKKLDHATTAETFTLDSSTAPTSITRAT